MDKYFELIRSAANEQPVEFKNQFNDILKNKLVDAVDARRDEISTSFSGNNKEENTEDKE